MTLQKVDRNRHPYKMYKRRKNDVNCVSHKTVSAKRVLSYLRIAEKLEEEAIKRYTDHIKQIENPEINALLEGIRRNEERHLRMLEQSIRAISTEEEL